jgi:hypothetical protein
MFHSTHLVRAPAPGALAGWIAVALRDAAHRAWAGAERLGRERGRRHLLASAERWAAVDPALAERLRQAARELA